MQPDGYVEFGHRLKNRQQVWIVERFPIDVGIELDASQPQAPDRVVDFAQRRRDIIERQAGNTGDAADRKSTRLNSSHRTISYAVFCLKKKNSTARRCSAAANFCGWLWFSSSR